MNEVLDITFHGKLSSNISFKLNKIATEKRDEFNEFISIISRPNIDNLDWWVEGPASRNTYSSPLFHYFCVFYLLKKIIDTNKFNYVEIILDSSSFAKVVEDLLIKSEIFNCKVKVKKSLPTSLKNLLKNFFLLYFLFIRKYYQILIARIFTSKLTSSKPIVLIDTFIMPGYIENDRWYGSFWSYLSEKNKQETFFVPTMVMTKFKDIFSVYKKAYESSRNYIFKETYLKFSDIFYAFRHSNRVKKLKINKIDVIGYDFSNIIKDELNNNKDLNSVFESILTYRYISRFKEAGFSVRLAIDWFEGQNLDKAWSMGFKRHYPNSKIIGYRPNESFPFYLSTFPISIESEANLLPDIFAIQGKATHITLSEFMPNLQSIIIPSFKSEYVWSFKRVFEANNFLKILVALPISVESSKSIIKRVLMMSTMIGNDNIKLTFKPHPAQSLKKIQASLGSQSRKAFFTMEKSFPSLLSVNDLLITEASSTCLESMACGIPVVMIQNEEGLTYDSIPDSVSETMYRKVRSKNELINAIKFFVKASLDNPTQFIIEGQKVRENYFEPVSKEGICRLMNFE
jgi:hypothetical protein